MTKSVTMCLAIPPNCQANVSLTKRNHLLAHKMILAQSQLRASKKLVYDLINLRCSCELYGFHRLLINYGTFGPIKSQKKPKMINSLFALVGILILVSFRRIVIWGIKTFCAIPKDDFC